MIDLSGYGLIIFDKDGTLIDFNSMWGPWIEALAQQLEASTGLALSAAIYEAMGYDAAGKQAIAGGQLAVSSMAGLRTLAGEVLEAQGLAPGTAEDALRAAWHGPDPQSSAQPLTDLPSLFAGLRAQGLKIAVVTSDDRGPTETTFAGLGLGGEVDVIVAADDGLPIKPAPHMVWTACLKTGVLPGKTIVVGDGVADLQMARAAGAGLAVGVTSGVSRAEMLAPYADLLLANVDEIMPDKGA